MTNKRLLLLIITLIGLLLLNPVSAKVITSKVDDKEIVDTYGVSFTVHTVDFGDINVNSDVYNKVMIGDNITFSSENNFVTYHTVYRINGALI